MIKFSNFGKYKNAIVTYFGGKEHIKESNIKIEQSIEESLIKEKNTKLLNLIVQQQRLVLTVRQSLLRHVA